MRWAVRSATTRSDSGANPSASSSIASAALGSPDDPRDSPSAIPDPASPPEGSIGRSSGRTFPRSMRALPSWFNTTKTPA